ncbi:hypothetical protein PGTUg99_016079 [Puccinia graminis f. sp. tritici]|uniref:C2H2-type domain-containing protein n=1 Tax=Puccinia graminis f. sp. tritici TaxID=56615 RepID=A0A5B0ND39_PUCGR|nr:hypothetical protein PGTUg99_016079 [Puccinia graminis f. sp. tritici]
MSDFNSSDMEFEAPKPQFPNLAKNAVEKIVADSSRARLESKKKVKSLQYITTPGVDYARAGWINKFNSYLSETLHYKEGKVPNDDAIIRFFASAPDFIENRRRNEESAAVTYGHFEQGLKHILNALTFRHSEFKATSHFKKRIYSLFNELANDGRLSRNPTRDKQRVGIHQMADLNKALFQQALRDNLSWDVTIQRLTTLAFQTAFACRAGDIAKSPQWDGTHVLKWKDIDIRYSSEEFIGAVLVGFFTLTQCKGEKNDAYHNETIRVVSTAPEHGLLCPLRLIISLAIRTHRVEPTTAAALFEQLRNSRSHRVVWTHPEEPVFSNIEHKNTGLLLGTSAPASQIEETMRKAANLAGFICQPITHDIRRGCAREVSKLKGVDVPDLQLAGQALFHKSKSTQLGTTKEYVGCMEFDHLNARLDQAPKKYSHGAPKLAENPYMPPGRQSTDQVSEHCKEYKLDPGIKQHRARATEYFKKDHQAEWSRKQLARQDLPIGEKESETNEIPPPLPKIPDALLDTYDIESFIDYMAKLTDRKRRIKTAKALQEASKKPRCAPIQGDSLGTRKKCPEPNCGIGTSFVSKKRLRDHMLKMHGKSQAQAEEAVLGATDVEHTPVASTSRS